METPNKVENGSVAETVVAPVVIPSQEPVKVEEDIITRASKFIEANQPKETQHDGVDFNSQEFNKILDGITDPVIKEQFIKKSKSLETGFNKKFMELASIRKEYESRLNQEQQWTPEKVQSLLQRSDFIEAAKAIVPSTPPEGMTAEEYSMLSETEKQDLASVKQELGFLKNERMQTLKKEEDSRLMSRYSNYNPEAVDQLLNDMMNGKVQATREALWKVLDYEPMAKRVYAMAMADKQSQNQERVNASVVPSGASVVPNSDLPKQGTNQSSKQYFVELGKRRLAEAKQMAGAK